MSRRIAIACILVPCAILAVAMASVWTAGVSSSPKTMDMLAVCADTDPVDGILSAKEMRRALIRLVLAVATGKPGCDVDGSGETDVADIAAMRAAIRTTLRGAEIGGLVKSPSAGARCLNPGEPCGGWYSVGNTGAGGASCCFAHLPGGACPSAGGMAYCPGVCGDGIVGNAMVANEWGGSKACTSNADCPMGVCDMANRDSAGNAHCIEQCDDGNRIDGDECTNACRTTTTSSTCGNERVDAGEACDDGDENGVACVPETGTVCAYCNATCSERVYVSPVLCCTCYYERTPVCSNRATEAACVAIECRDGIDNDRDGRADYEDEECTAPYGIRQDARESVAGYQQNDCMWNATIGACIGFPEDNCRTADFSSCDRVRLLAGNEDSTVPYPKAWQCTTVHDTYEGHSDPEQCKTFTETARRCIECSTAACVTLANNGCSTFANQNDALASAKSLQTLLGRSGVKTIILKGNQMIASNACTSVVTYTVTESDVKTTYAPCGFGEVCHEEGAVFKCEDQGVVREGACCGFVKKPAIGGACSRSGQYVGYSDVDKHRSCDAALAEAQAKADALGRIFKENCETDSPSATYTESCEPREDNAADDSKWCNYSVSCSWKCE